MCLLASPTGGRGVSISALLKSRGDDPPPPRNLYISVHFFLKHVFCIFRHFQNKVAEMAEEKLNFGCRWVWVAMNSSPSPIKTSLRCPSLRSDINHVDCLQDVFGL